MEYLPEIICTIIGTLAVLRAVWLLFFVKLDVLEFMLYGANIVFEGLACLIVALICLLVYAGIRWY